MVKLAPTRPRRGFFARFGPSIWLFVQGGRGPPSKRTGLHLAFILLESIGLQLSVSISPDFADRLARRFDRR